MLTFYRSSNEKDNVSNLMIIAKDWEHCKHNAYNYFKRNKCTGYPVCYACNKF